MKLISAKELAPMLELSSETVSDYARRQIIPSIKIGSEVHFDLDRVNTWINDLHQARKENK